jgi:hypothetical protein
MAAPGISKAETHWLSMDQIRGMVYLEHGMVVQVCSGNVFQTRPFLVMRTEFKLRPGGIIETHYPVPEYDKQFKIEQNDERHIERGFRENQIERPPQQTQV